MKNSVKNSNPATYKRVTASGEASQFISLLKGTCGLASLIGFFLSRASFSGAMTPLGLAWYAVCGNLDTRSIVAAGCLAGAFFSPVGHARIKYITAIFAFWVIKKYVLEKNNVSVPVSCAVASGTLLFCGLIFNILGGFVPLDVVLSFVESAIVWLGGIIFSRGAEVIQRKGKVFCDDESIAAAIVLGASIAGTSGINLLGLELSNIVSMYIILFCAYRGGVSISGAVGAALGLIAGLCRGDAPALTGVFAFVGLVSGTMNIFGKWGVCFSALFSNALFAAYYSSSSIIFINVLEIIVASAAFFATPENAMDFLQRYSIKTRSFDSSVLINLKVKTLTDEGFSKINSLLGGVRDAFTFSGKSEAEEALTAVMCDRVSAHICDRCNLRRYCWSRNFGATSKMMTRLCGAVANGHDGDIKSIVSGKCIRGESLINCAFETFSAASRDYAEKKRVDRCIQTAFSGWDTAGRILNQTQKTFFCETRGFESLSGELTEAIGEVLGKPCCASVVTNLRAMPEVSVLTEKEFTFDPGDTVSAVVGVPMYLADEKYTENGCITRFLPEENFCFEVSTASMDNCKKNESGDCEKHFVSDGGYFYCIICDGMGSGSEAAKDSLKTAEIFEKLALGGMELKEIAKIINAGIMTTWGDERCISADLLKFDLFSGEGELIKLGGVATTAKLDGNVEVFENSHVPMGILSYEKINSELFFIKEDGYIVLMTDGVPDSKGDRKTGEDFVKNIVLSGGGANAKALADTVLMSSIADSNPKDDMLVTVVKLYKR